MKKGQILWKKLGYVDSEIEFLSDENVPISWISHRLGKGEKSVSLWANTIGTQE